MPYIGKPQSSDPITVNASNIEDGSIIPADIKVTGTISTFRICFEVHYANVSG